MSSFLLHAFGIDHQGHMSALDMSGVENWQRDQGVIWVHLDANDSATVDWLSSDASLPQLVPEALVADETRPRSSMINNGLLIVLRGVNLNPGADQEDMVSLRIWIDEDRIISTRIRSLLSVTDTVDSVQRRPVKGTADLLLRIVDGIVDRIGDAINEVEDRVAALEDSVLKEPGSVLRSRLSELRREAIALRRYLAPQREALGRLHAEPLSWFADIDRMRLREIYDRQVRLVEDLDAVRERATVIHEELVSQLSDQLNKRMYVLSIVAALFLPLGFLTGLLGINVGGIPGADDPRGFWIFAGILIALLSAQIWFFIRKKWF